MTEWIQNALDEAGYWALALLMFLENVFPPIPSEVVLPLAGFQVGRGSMVFVLALLAATAGSVVGAVMLREIGVRGGRPLLLAHPRIFRVDEKDLDKGEEWFERWGSWAVLFGRLLPFVRSVISIPAGTLQMPLKRFVVLTAVGSTAWNAVLMAAGQAVGENWQTVSHTISRYSPFVVTIAISAVVLYFVLRHKNRQASRVKALK